MDFIIRRTLHSHQFAGKYFKWLYLARISIWSKLTDFSRGNFFSRNSRRYFWPELPACCEKIPPEGLSRKINSIYFFFDDLRISYYLSFLQLFFVLALIGKSGISALKNLIYSSRWSWLQRSGKQARSRYVVTRDGVMIRSVLSGRR